MAFCFYAFRKLLVLSFQRIIPKVPTLEALKFDQIIENCPILKGDFSLEFVSIKQV